MAMSRTVLTGAMVFEGTGAPFAQADLVVEDGRFVDVGSGLDGDERVDLSGKHVIPGLFDCHVHVVGSHLDTMKYLETPLSYLFVESAKNLEITLRRGITTVRDAGGADLGIKRAVEDGLIRGPRMQISLTMLSQTGGHGDPWMPCGGILPIFPPYPGMPSPIVDGPLEMRRKVREVIRDGADVIKVAATGGVLSDRDDPAHAHFQADELEELVREAAFAGRFVMTHSHGAEGTKRAVRAGVRSIEHGTYLDDEAIELMVEHGTWLVPTLVSGEGTDRALDDGVAMSEAVRDKIRSMGHPELDSFRRAVEAGVKVAMGTDCPVAPHGENLGELRLMAEHGMTPAQALVAATSSAAELMGLDAELGTIEPGKRADLVVVDGDPFEYEKLADRIEAVYKDGTRVV
jgi:imidazolonepropionase-like amidohydrolase